MTASAGAMPTIDSRGGGSAATGSAGVPEGIHLPLASASQFSAPPGVAALATLS